MKRGLLDLLESGGESVHLLPISRNDADLLSAVGGERGLNVAVADLADCHDKDEFLARVALSLDFPDWFGRNWDAFFDCLADLSWTPAAGHVLVLLNPADLQRDAPETYDTALSILRDAATVWARRGGCLRTIVDAPPGKAGRTRRSGRPDRT